jgi:hypothetical protein
MVRRTSPTCCSAASGPRSRRCSWAARRHAPWWTRAGWCARAPPAPSPTSPVRSSSSLSRVVGSAGASAWGRPAPCERYGSGFFSGTTSSARFRLGLGSEGSTSSVGLASGAGAGATISCDGSGSALAGGTTTVGFSGGVRVG